MNNLSEYNHFISNFEFKKGDTVILASDVTNLMSLYKKNGHYFNLNLFIDSILDSIGDEGTLLIPTHNWDFCKGITFDYVSTPSMTGSLGKIALKRNDFKRTTNPIYSFAVNGFDKEFLFNLSHFSCFGEDSPFQYLHKKNAKFFSISLDFKEAGFTPAHYVEEKIGVSYRYFKYFTGNYIDQNRITKKVKYKFYVADTSKVVKTGMKKNIDNILIDINAYKKYHIKDEFFSIMELGKALDVFIEDMKNQPEDERLIYPMKTGGFKREKINKIIIYD